MKNKKEQLNFPNVISLLERTAKNYDSIIKEIEYKELKYDWEYYKKILAEFQSAIEFLKRLQKLKVIKKAVKNE